MQYQNQDSPQDSSSQNGRPTKKSGFGHDGDNGDVHQLRLVDVGKLFSLLESFGVMQSLRTSPIEAATGQQLPPSENVVDAKIVIVHGGFIYRGQSHRLTGKPLKVLKALAEARFQILTLDQLHDRIWIDAIVSNETIRSAVSTARQALRRALLQAGHQPADRFDPIRALDRGNGSLAWRLNLP